MFKPLPITLQRGALRLEPLVEADIPELVSLAEANREALQYMDGPTRPDWYRQSLAEQREGRALPLAVRLGVQLVGTTRFAEFLPALPACEIGWTWLDQAQHGSGLNRMIKYLMLKHAFDNLRMVRVQPARRRATCAPRAPSTSSARSARACCATTGGWPAGG